MTDFSAAHIGIQHRPGKHNMASAAFQDLQAARREGRPPEGGQLSFGDLIDTLNPLQHIPVVGEVYRGLTEDRISPQARVAGGALWGGPMGLVASVASLAIGGNGRDGLGDQLYASLLGNEEETTVAMAAETPQPATTENVELSTASITPPAMTKAAREPAPPASPEPQNEAQAKPLPRLSPEAFQALIGSFANPDADRPGTLDAKANAGQSPDLASAMLDALDKYEAMKTDRPAR